MLTVLFAVMVLAGASATADEVTLKDKLLLVAFDTDSGALTRLEDKSTHWTIERRPELGVSFRLNAPSSDQRDNFVLGQKQHAVEVKKLSAHQVRLQWKDLVSEHGGVLAMTLTATVTLTNGALTFDAALENDSPRMVSTIDFPYLGDLNTPAKGAPMWSEHMWYGNLQSGDISFDPIHERRALRRDARRDPAIFARFCF